MPNFQQLLIGSILKHIYKNFHSLSIFYLFFSPKKALENRGTYVLHFEFPFTLCSMTFLQLFLDFFICFIPLQFALAFDLPDCFKISFISSAPRHCD